MANRPFRICDVCGQIDDHPRYTLATVGAPVDPDLVRSTAQRTDFPAEVVNAAVESLLDTEEQVAHFDCSVESGRDAEHADGAHAAALAAAGGNRQALLRYLKAEQLRLNREHLAAGRMTQEQHDQLVAALEVEFEGLV